jgi:hypothetical protein
MEHSMVCHFREVNLNHYHRSLRGSVVVRLEQFRDGRIAFEPLTRLKAAQAPTHRQVLVQRELAKCLSRLVLTLPWARRILGIKDGSSYPPSSGVGLSLAGCTSTESASVSPAHRIVIIAILSVKPVLLTTPYAEPGELPGPRPVAFELAVVLGIILPLRLVSVAASTLERVSSMPTSIVAPPDISISNTIIVNS